MERRNSKTKTWASGTTRQPIPSRNRRHAGGRLLRVLRHFNSDTSGAVTVEFMVLTAAIVSMGVMAAGAISAGVDSSIARTESCLVTAAGTLASQEGLSTLQKKQETGQRCGRLLGLKEVAMDTEIVKLVR